MPERSMPLLAELAKREQLRLRGLRQAKASGSVGRLLDFIPRMTPKFQRPVHLAEVAERLERFREEPFEFVFSVPVRHSKTELILHFIVWAAMQYPGIKIAYVTYSAEQAISKAKRTRAIADAAGLRRDNSAIGQWDTPAGGMIHFLGIAGSLTGKGFDIIIVDDALKSRAEAESPVFRQRAWEFYQNDCITRLEPGGSFICIMARWHEDDLAGRLTTPDPEEDWPGLPYINMPAISNEGTPEETALWPERWSLDALHTRRKRVGEYAWASLYQGQPRPRGSTVFGDPHFFTELPQYFTVGQGIDLAYSDKTSADWNVMVTLFKAVMMVRAPGDSAEHEEEWFYVRHVIRRQARAPEFRDAVKLERARFPGARLRFYGAGTETGAADWLKKPQVVNGRVVDRGIDIEVLPPRGDKFTRAIGFAAAWNDGRVFVPSPDLVEQNPTEYGWVHDYLDVLRAFSGQGSAHDDDVDASVGAFDLVATPPLKYHPASNKLGRRM